MSNAAGWFAAGREQSRSFTFSFSFRVFIMGPHPFFLGVVLSPLVDLRVAFSSPRDAFQYKIMLELPQKPTHVKFAFNEKVLMVALVTGQIACYDTNHILSAVGPSRPYVLDIDVVTA